MNNEVYSLLESAGWYENRNIDIDYEMEILKREGFTLPNAEISALITGRWAIA